MPAHPSIPRIELEINGKAWTQVESLDHSGPRDRHFTVTVNGDRANLHFGDGKHGQRPPGGARAVSTVYREGSGYLRLVLQTGRVPLENDWNEPPDGKLCGLYRGVVTDNQDPLQQMRLKVQVPQALGLVEAWALPCLPPGPASLPHPGKHVWVLFEQGDPKHPVWVGMMRD